ncbi:MAG: DMT family transporter [Alphaproteobacteria bacterium]|nr:DMT family transporter [Alphaproteobacteria bacterium]MCZ6840458.1 DMT family transporter [Alphaproteobacteria bacterium]
MNDGDKIPFGIPQPVLAALSMMLGAAALAANHSLVRVVTEELHPLEASALRFLWAVPIMLPWLLRGRGTVLRTRRHGLHLATAGLTVVMTVAFFIALSQMPLAEATALNFTAPLFTTIIAALMLKERVEFVRWGATVIGFIGVLIILRPGFADIPPVALLPMFGAFLLAWWFIAVKRLSATESTATITIYQTLWSALLLTLIAVPVWITPTWATLGYSAAMGGLGTTGIIFTSRAFSMAEASIVAPLDYVRLPFIAIVAYIAFGEVPDGLSIVGALIITASAIYIVRRAARLEL